LANISNERGKEKTSFFWVCEIENWQTRKRIEITHRSDARQEELGEDMDSRLSGLRSVSIVMNCFSSYSPLTQLFLGGKQS
jgi:hypothetical protein